MVRRTNIPTPPEPPQPAELTAEQAEAKRKAKAKRKADARRKAAEARLRSELKLFRFCDNQVERVVHTSTIICAICSNKVVNIYILENGVIKCETAKRSLDSMADMRELGFVRIHQSVVLNMAYYVGITNDKEIVLSIKFKFLLKVSARYMSDFRSFLKAHTY